MGAQTASRGVGRAGGGLMPRERQSIRLFDPRRQAKVVTILSHSQLVPSSLSLESKSVFRNWLPRALC